MEVLAKAIKKTKEKVCTSCTQKGRWNLQKKLLEQEFSITEYKNRTFKRRLFRYTRNKH